MSSSGGWSTGSSFEGAQFGESKWRELKKQSSSRRSTRFSRPPVGRRGPQSRPDRRAGQRPARDRWPRRARPSKWRRTAWRSLLLMAPATGLADLFKGPTMLAYAADPIAAPKVATEFAQTERQIRRSRRCARRFDPRSARCQGLGRPALARRIAGEAHWHDPDAGNPHRGAAAGARQPACKGAQGLCRPRTMLRSRDRSSSESGSNLSKRVRKWLI